MDSTVGTSAWGASADRELAQRGSGSRRLTRTVLGVSMVLAPLAVGVIRSLIPYATMDSGATGAAGIAAHPERAQAVMVAGVIASLLLPLATLGLIRLVRRDAPLLGTIGGGMALVGWSLVPMLVTMDAVLYEAAHSPSNGALTTLWDHVQNGAVVTSLTIAFVLLHTIGMLLLGIGLARSGSFPRWAAGALIVGIVVHPIGAFSGNRGLDIGAFVLITIGFVAAASAVLRSAPHPE